MTEQERYVRAYLANPDHKLPIPGTQRLFSAGDDGEPIDRFDPYWRMCIVDGSIVLGVRSPSEDAPGEGV